jgi:Putative Actinobacterial Holin-X, holin superfamily III
MAETTYTAERQHVREPDSTRGERSVVDLVRDITGNAQEIMRSEIRLARTEIREEAVKAGKAGGLLAGGAVIGLFGLNFLFWSLIFGLSTWVPMSASALIIAIFLAIVAGVMVLAGRSRMKEVNVKPERTVNSLREGAEWLKNQTR